jgi:hypothetical protein
MRILLLINASFMQSEEMPVNMPNIILEVLLKPDESSKASPCKRGRTRAANDWRLSASHSSRTGGGAHRPHFLTEAWSSSLRMTGCRSRQTQQDNLRLAQVDHDPAAGQTEDLALKQA